MTRAHIRYLRRGEVVELPSGDPSATLLDHLRLDCHAKGTKEGCNEGDCGACTVVLARIRDGKLAHEPVNSCILLAGQADGSEVITVEDLAKEGILHPVQQAMVDNHGSQCGFCTPGIVMSLFALYQDAARPVDFQTITDQLAGNLCRCTGYRPIVAAAKAACGPVADDTFSRTARSRIVALQQLNDGADVFLGDETRFFAAPANLDQLAARALQHPDAVLVGGATDIGLWITKKLQDLPKVIWLGRVSGLDEIKDLRESLELGAMVTLKQAQPFLAAVDQDLGEVVRRFGSEQVRASATVGGNIANGSPIGDLAPCLIALDSLVRLQKGAEKREFLLEEYFLAYGKQDLEPGEFVRSLRIPRLKPDERLRCYKVSKRFDEDISAVMAAFRFTLDGNRVVGARIAFGGMAATPKRGRATEAALAGVSLLAPASWEAAFEALSNDFQPIDDMRATGAYRLATARALLQKALFELNGVPTELTRILGHRESVKGISQ